jgi:hypothetical protein
VISLNAVSPGTGYRLPLNINALVKPFHTCLERISLTLVYVPQMACPIDLFDDIVAIAAGEENNIRLEDAVKTYDQEGLKRALKLWKRSVTVLTTK